MPFIEVRFLASLIFTFSSDVHSLNFLSYSKSQRLISETNLSVLTSNFVGTEATSTVMKFLVVSLQGFHVCLILMTILKQLCDSYG